MNDSKLKVQKLGAGSAEAFTRVGEGEVFVRDVVDLASEPSAEMTVGFARVGAGETMEITFPYDEVLVITRGIYALTTEQGETVVARAGDAVYLPAGSLNLSHAEEDTEMVYVAAPPETYARHVAASAAAMA